MHQIEFRIAEVPSKGRPRFRAMGKFMRTYTPLKTQISERNIALAFLEASSKIKDLPKLPYAGPVAVSIEIWRTAPRSLRRRQQRIMEDAHNPCMSKPDLDNTLKIVLDSLNGCGWTDDKNVYFAMVEKRYGAANETVVRVVLLEEVVV